MREKSMRECVEEFIEAFDAASAPWPKLVSEELGEFFEAVNRAGELPATITDEDAMPFVVDILKELCDVIYVVIGCIITATDTKSMIPLDDFVLVKAANDLGNMIFTKEQIKEAFFMVHASNMSKLGDDGRPIRREDGKILKGPNYKPAEVRFVIDPSLSTTT